MTIEDLYKVWSKKRPCYFTPSGQVVLGKWLGGLVWMPEGSSMYVYYNPLSWRLVLESPPAEAR